MHFSGMMHGEKLKIEIDRDLAGTLYFRLARVIDVT